MISALRGRRQRDLGTNQCVGKWSSRAQGRGKEARDTLSINEPWTLGCKELLNTVVGFVILIAWPSSQVAERLEVWLSSSDLAWHI